jgi:plastocyanin
MTMRPLPISNAVLSLIVLIGAAPTSQPSGATVSGRVAAAGGAAVPEMIVYLEPVDANVKFDPPTEKAAISQKGARFAPSLLIVSVGQTVEFKNDEDRPIEHNVFSRSPAQPFDLGLYRPPEAKPVTFNTPGLVRLFCSIHRLMDGMIYVCPTPFWARVDSTNGRYEITNVPQGNWRLKTWQRSPRFNEQDLALSTQAAPVTLDLQLSRK